MTGLVGYLLLFVVVGVVFVLFHLMLGRLVRPIKPDPEKLTIYECGEPTIGSAWIQFDLRFYVVALLFVIFDVEVAFFFPWAVVFGKASTLARPDLPEYQRIVIAEELDPLYGERLTHLALHGEQASSPEERQRLESALTESQAGFQGAARELAWVAFWDIVVFFGVLLVGFAYLWKRGDLNWVRSTAAEVVPPPGVGEQTPAPESSLLVGAGRR